MIPLFDLDDTIPNNLVESGFRAVATYLKKFTAWITSNFGVYGLNRTMVEAKFLTLYYSIMVFIPLAELLPALMNIVHIPDIKPYPSALTFLSTRNRLSTW